jgi:hypothetical protein
MIETARALRDKAEVEAKKQVLADELRRIGRGP